MRLTALFFAVCLAATAQTLTVAQLSTFIANSIQLMKQGKQSDKETADFLGSVKLSERLDDRAVEELEGQGAGPRTLAALRKLAQQSQVLTPPKQVEAPASLPVRPPPTAEEQAKIIDAVRDYALNYSADLPDFICTEVQRRSYAAPPGTRYGGPRGSQPSYQLNDTLTIRLSYVDQKEDYKPVLVNGALTTKDYKSLGGTIISGDFGSMLKQIFERETEARFEWDHWSTLRGKLTMAFAYHVPQDRSQYRVSWEQGNGMSIVPGYSGLIFVDPQTHVVVRVTLKPDNMPPDFPIHYIETTLDYDYADISGHTFLLPIKDETLSTLDDELSKVDTEFHNYHKYSAESELKFDTDTPDPLPPEKTKETPVAPAQPETPATQPMLRETPATQPPPKKK